MNPEFLGLNVRNITLSFALAAGLCTPSAHAQQDSTQATETWWKGLFRPVEMPECNPQPSGARTTDSVDLKGPWRPAMDTSLILDTEQSSVALPPASFEWTLPDGLAELDSLDKADPAPLQGYRIQIYFGGLKEARGVRAAFRRDHPEVDCQLLPIAPNYAVTVGNYRDTWAAQRALRDGEVGAWKNALVIPSPIDLPPLR